MNLLLAMPRTQRQLSKRAARPAKLGSLPYRQAEAKAKAEAEAN
jgi:hypothetical protein